MTDRQIDFVSISEHTSAFPSGGWLTRRNIEAEIPLYGPAALDAQQRALADAAKRSREAEGSSRQIGFVSAKKGDEVKSSRNGRWEERSRASREDEGYRGRDKREKERYRDKERDRENRKDRYRDRY